MTPLQAVTLGVVQGLAEFLPISSSAHLAAFPWLLGWPDPGLAFDTALHLGTAAAVLYFFRHRWLRLASAALRDPRSGDARLLLMLAAATVPGGLAGLAFEKRIAALESWPPLLGADLIAFGLLLGAASRWGARRLALEEAGWREAMIIGCAQALALAPGVSRSGITITAGLFLGLTYEAAATFSFLLSLPITLAAALHQVAKLPDGLSGPPFWLGLLAATLSGVAAIRFLLDGLRRWGVKPFVIYRVAFGLLLIALWLARG